MPGLMAKTYNTKLLLTKLFITINLKYREIAQTPHHNT
jgi:hypothetical protein